MTSAADLFALQEVDLKRDSRRALLADIEARLGETEELSAAREELEDAGKQAEDLKSQQRELENQIEDLEAKIRPVETKLYDGSVRNPKELSDLQAELEHLKQRKGALDDQGLANLEIVEAAEATVTEAREDLERIEWQWQEEQAELQKQRERTEQEMAQLDSDRELRTHGMNASMLGLYEKLRPIKAGRAVARVDRGTCQGCRVSLPTNMVHKVREAAGLVQCPRCERILVAG